MQLGIGIPHYGIVLDGPALRDAVQSAEALGFDSAWAADHIVLPGDTQLMNWRYSLECLGVLTYAAAVTTRIKLGSSVLILPYRNPLVIAKEVATLDVLSGGRVILGVGVGYVEGEFSALGAPYKERGRFTDEALMVIKELWTSESPAFDGRYYSFKDMIFSPKPVQKPHPPIWVGGGSRAAMRRACLHGDAWQPFQTSPEEMEQAAAELRAVAAGVGMRPPALAARVRVAFGGDAGGSRGRSSVVSGTPEEIAAALRLYEKAGVEHLGITFRGEDAAVWMKEMERFAKEVMTLLGGI